MSCYSLVNLIKSNYSLGLFYCMLLTDPYALHNNLIIAGPDMFIYYFSEFRDCFALFDKKGDSKIQSKQIGDVLRALNLNPSQADVDRVVQEIDPMG